MERTACLVRAHPARKQTEAWHKLGITSILHITCSGVEKGDWVSCVRLYEILLSCLLSVYMHGPISQLYEKY